MQAHAPLKQGILKGIPVLPVLVSVFLCLAFWPNLVAPARAATDKDLGIQIVALRMTASDHFVDCRYRVVDAEKAKPFMARKTEISLIDQATGKKLPVSMTRLGSMRSTSTKPRTDKVYNILFRNFNKTVVSGNLVTLVSGDAKVENLKVE